MLEAAPIFDPAPTFARILGVDLPNCEGRPVPELLPGGAAV